MLKATFILTVFILLPGSLGFGQNNIVNRGLRSLFTPQEQQYLAEKKLINVCVDPSWMPFEGIANNKHVGMSADYLELISQQFGLSFHLVPTRTWVETLEKGRARECDIFSLAMTTPERRSYMRFTTPYIVIPLVIATTKDKPFIADLPDVINHRIGLVRGYAFIEFLRADYPEVEIVEFDTIYDGLVALEKNQIYGFIDNLTTISYEISRSFSSSVKISGRVERNWELGIAVRNDDPVLFSILEKIVSNIDSKIVQEIQNKWVSVTYEHRFDYSLLWKVLAGSGVVIFLFFYRYRKISRFNKTLQDLNLKLKESEASFRYLTENAHEGIVVVQHKRLVYVNPSMCTMTGYDKESLLKLETFLPLIAPEARDDMLANHIKRLSGKASPVRYESLFLKRDGTVYPIELTGVLINWHGLPATLNIISDISERKASEEAIRYLAHHDNLTGLPNRYLLMERLDQSLSQAQRSGQRFGVLFIDLDGFKQVNDIHGHDTGDQLLKDFAARLQLLMRGADTLARMGGDEFVVLLPSVDGPVGVDSLIQRISVALEKPFHMKSIDFYISASIGFSLFPDHGTTAAELLRYADHRMYDVKQAKFPS